DEVAAPRGHGPLDTRRLRPHRAPRPPDRSRPRPQRPRRRSPRLEEESRETRVDQRLRAVVRRPRVPHQCTPTTFHAPPPVTRPPRRRPPSAPPRDPRPPDPTPTRASKHAR